jgi:hypothetical protein
MISKLGSLDDWSMASRSASGCIRNLRRDGKCLKGPSKTPDLRTNIRALHSLVILPAAPLFPFGLRNFGIKFRQISQVFRGKLAGSWQTMWRDFYGIPDGIDNPKVVAFSIGRTIKAAKGAHSRVQSWETPE